MSFLCTDGGILWLRVLARDVLADAAVRHFLEQGAEHFHYKQQGV